MSFDLTITLGNVLTLLTFAGAFVLLLVRHRDALAEVRAASKNRCDLLEQAHDFLKQQMADDRARSDSHWREVKETLQRIDGKLDAKMDKPD